MLNKIISKVIAIMTGLVSKSIFSTIESVNKHVTKNVTAVVKRIDKIESMIEGNETDPMNDDVSKSLVSIQEMSDSLTLLSQRIKELATENKQS